MTNIFFKYGVISTLIAVWAIVLVSYATYNLFYDIQLITAASVSAYSALLALPAVAFGVYKWRNTDKDNDGKPD